MSKQIVSFTKIQDYLNCPYSFKLKHLDKVDCTSQSLTMWYGYVAEELIRRHIDNPRKPKETYKTAVEAFMTCYEKLPYVSEEFKNAFFDFIQSYPHHCLSQTAILNNLANGLSRKEFAYNPNTSSASRGAGLFTSGIFVLIKEAMIFFSLPLVDNFFNNIESVEQQVPLEADFNFIQGYGIADLIITTKQGERLLLDIKFSKHNSSLYNLNSDYQLAFYKLLYERTHNHPIQVGHLNLRKPEKEAWVPLQIATPSLETELITILKKIYNDSGQENSFLKVCGTGSYNSLYKRCNVKDFCSHSSKRK